MKTRYLFTLILLTLSSCIGGGTHGYIKAYRYHTTKSELERAVHQAITINPAIHRDTVKDYYNDGKYITIEISNKGLPYTYTFRFYGGNEYWDTARTSEIFIAYAYDEQRRGGSEGNGGVTWVDVKLKKRLTEPFERELVDRIDSILEMGHTVE
jgi:hypothetical protein